MGNNNDDNNDGNATGDSATQYNRMTMATGDNNDGATTMAMMTMAMAWRAMGYDNTHDHPQRSWLCQ